MPILSRFAGGLPSTKRIDIVLARLFASSVADAPKQVRKTLITNVPGYCVYERDVSRDPKALAPQKPGDTPKRYLLRRLGHAYEIYPLIALLGVWVVLFVFTVWTSFNKIEVWLDRSNPLPPWHWSRVRDKYWKLPTLAFDPTGKTHRRLPIMEQLQDELLEAARKRGAYP